jgi:hypothetical protein
LQGRGTAEGGGGALKNPSVDPHDGRRVFVELAPETSAALRRYFAELGKVAAI